MSNNPSMSTNQSTHWVDEEDDRIPPLSELFPQEHNREWVKEMEAKYFNVIKPRETDDKWTDVSHKKKSKSAPKSRYNRR